MKDEREVAADLGRHILKKLDDLLNRDLQIAIAVGLPEAEVALMALKIAASISNAMILVAVQFRKEGVVADALYDQTLVMLSQLTTELKQEGLRKVCAAQVKPAKS